jgi:NitT/TauT family transport system ATP-binding protein
VLSARPARVREEVAIELPRPRGIAVRKSVAFLQARNRIWDLIREEKPS